MGCYGIYGIMLLLVTFIFKLLDYNISKKIIILIAYLNLTKKNIKKQRALYFSLLLSEDIQRGRPWYYLHKSMCIKIYQLQ